MAVRRRLPDQISRMLRTADSLPSGMDGGALESSSTPSIVDIRDPRGFRRSHLMSSVSIPARMLPSRLYLLPDRTHQLCIVAATGAAAKAGAEHIADKGWTDVVWLDGSPLDLPESSRTHGEEPHRLWNPTPLLAKWLDALPSGGLCCDLACGCGRDAAALAIGGRSVVGVDVLPDALLRARLLVRLARVPWPGQVQFRRMDLRDLVQAGDLLRKDRFGILTCFRYLNRELLPLMFRAIAPGGYLIYETFLSYQAEIGRTPRRISRLLDPGELHAASSGFEVLEYWERPDIAGDWLASLVARRPE